MFLAKSFPWPRVLRRGSRHGLMLSLALLGLLLAPACGSRSGGIPVAPPPVVLSTNLPKQYPGQMLTLTGSGFTGADMVTIGGVQVSTFTLVDDRTITLTVPATVAAGEAVISVHTPSGDATATVTVTVLPLPPAPVVTAPDSPSGGPGKIVTLTGAGFTTVIGVSFGGVPADPQTIRVLNDTTLTVQIPAGAFGKGLITVINPGGSGNSNGDFTVINPPSVATFLPNPGSPGRPLVLTGVRFTGITAVLFAGATPGTTVAGTILSGTATQMTVRVPATAADGVIRLEGPQGSGSTAPDLFTVQSASLAVTDFNPKQGPEGTVVTLSGTDLGLVMGVAFGGVSAVSALTLSADGSSLTVQVPPGAVSGPLAIETAGNPPFTGPGGSFTVQSPPLSVTGFSSSVVGGVQTMTITGANLSQVTGVSFTGGATTATFTVSTNGTSLTVPVPGGAKTGPVGVLTAGGPMPVPGGDLTVVASAPAITAFNPAEGVPGTEVTLAGSGFTGTNQVTYAGMALDATRFNVDSDTQIRVRVPDDAQASATISVTTPVAPPAETALFTLLPSRDWVLPQPFVKEPGVFGAGEWLDFPTRRRAAMYQEIRLPQAPVFHAYHPSGEVPPDPEGNRDPGFPATQYTLNLQLPSAPFYEVLPPEIKAQLQVLGITPANLDIFVNSQSYQYDGVTPRNGVYLLRPHYWTDPTAPNSGLYYVLHNLQGAIYDAAPGVTLSGNPSGAFFNFVQGSTHCPSPTVAGPVIASPNSEPIAGFDVTASDGLWSLVYEIPTVPPLPPTQPATTAQLGRAAVTLHLLFNDADQATLNTLTGTVNTVRDLLLGLATSPTLSASRGVRMLMSLGRPVVNTATQGPLAGTANKLVVLSGSGLANATVLLDGIPVDPAAIQNISDAIVNVTLPLGATGTIVVLGADAPSDPVALPPS